MKVPPAAAALLVLALLLTTSPLGGGLEPGTQAHPANACSAPYHLQWAEWDLCWQQDDARTQGIEINRAFFKGQSVIWKMGAPFSLTQYEPGTYGPFKDTFGNPGQRAGGTGYGLGAMTLDETVCPRFYDGDSTLLNSDRLCVERRGGPAPELTIWARYNIYNYRFMQGWRFDDRGSIHPMVAMGGHLIDGSGMGELGSDHYHHLFWRIDFDIGAPGIDTFQQYQRGNEGSQAHIGTGDQGIGIDRTLPAAAGCTFEGSLAATGWCERTTESALLREARAHTKWRVADKADTNARGHAKSYEFTLHQSDHPPTTFTTFDVLLVQHQGDSQEIGYEVPTNPLPHAGDLEVLRYLTPPEDVDDPVVWAVLNIHHDTRDEERGSMAYHWVEYEIRPRNFLDQNPSESTFP